MELFYKIKNKFIINEYQLRYIINFKTEDYCKDLFEDIKFYIATLKDINDIRQYYKDEFTEYKYNLYKQRIEEKDKIIIVSKISEKICGYFNISLVNTYESGIDQYIEVNENEAYFFDDYVFKKFRGKSIQKMSVLYRLDLVKKRKRKIIYVNIYCNNKASRKSYEKLGFKIIKKYRKNKITKRIKEENLI